MNQLVNQQQLKKLESDFANNFMAVNVLINQTREAHENIENIMPVEELKTYLEGMSKNIPQIKNDSIHTLLKKREVIKINRKWRNYIQYT